MRAHLVLILLILISCKQDTKQINSVQYKGKTMGTTYTLKFLGGKTPSHAKIDQKLIDLNANFSTYIDNSNISLFNDSSKETITLTGEAGEDFEEVFLIAKKVYKASQRKFDPTVKPLVDYWGFGKEKKPRVHTAAEVDSLLQLVGFNKLTLERDENRITIRKSNPLMQLDFSAIAKGFAVDKLAELLEENKVENYMVEVGGETRCKGKNRNGQKWTLGISEPSPDAALNSALIKIQPGDKSLASSGNYRNFYTIDGKTYNHTINPVDGMAFPSDLLGVSIIANDCTTADAIATACMAMGKESSKKYIESTAHVHASFFYEKDGKILVDYSKNFEQYIVN